MKATIEELLLQALDEWNYEAYQQLLEDYSYTESWTLEEDRKLSLKLSSI